jgi:hypothetical protein
MSVGKAKSTKWLAGGLILSLGLNLFLGGFLVTHMMRPDPFSIFPKIPIRELIKDLPKEAREKAKASMQARHPVLHQQFEAMKQAQLRLQQAIKADPFNRDELDAAFDNLREKRAALEQNLQSGFVEIITMLPAEDRRNLAVRWYRPPPKREHHLFSHSDGDEHESLPPSPPPPSSPPSSPVTP